MKQLIVVFFMVFTVFSACNTATDNSSNGTTKGNSDTSIKETPNSASKASKEKVVVKEIIGGYLQMKNALADDNSKDASRAGNEIITALGKVDQSAIAADQKEKYQDLADDIKENAEHVSTNSGKLEHQREHFEMLSKDIYDLVKTFGAGQTLYKDFCSMANDNKGAFWVSETKEIKNPYTGKEMPTCGEVKEELK